MRALCRTLFALLLAVAPAAEASVSDDFADGNDSSPAWSHFAPTAGATFNAGSLSYAIGVPATGNALNPARALSLREDASFTSVVVAADLVAFDNAASHRYGVIARSTSSTAPTHDGYALVITAPGALALLQINNQVPTTLVTRSIALNPSLDYRLVLAITGSSPARLTGTLFAASDLTTPIAAVTHSDSLAPIYTGGFTGVYVADASAPQSQPLAATFDDFFASDSTADTDADGLTDAIELSIGTDPSDADTDGDGLSDGQEIGAGNFGAGVQVSDSGGISVSAADVDGDGDMDVISAASIVSWSENDGTPDVGAWTTRTISSSSSLRSAYAADVDGDGDTDVVSASYSDDTIVWYENDGTPTLGAWPERAIATTADGPISVSAADMDGDGDMDAVSASSLASSIAWYENDGTPALGAWPVRTIWSPAGSGMQSIYTADMDSDGDMDVLSLLSTEVMNVAWSENDGTPAVGAWPLHPIIASEFPSPSGNLTHRIFPADLDADGDTDLITQFSFFASGLINRSAWMTNDGAGNLGFGGLIEFDASGSGAVSAADMDGDGDTDVLGPSAGTAAWYENDGTPTTGLWIARAISTVAPTASSLVAVDLDRDGDGDVLSTSGSTVVWFEQQNLADPFDPDTDGDGLSDGAELNIHGTSPTVADTDRDGLGDGVEVNTHGTNPLLVDSDADGLRDDFEVANGFDPLDSDQDSDNRVDGQDDFDNDGLGNAAEALAGMDPNDPDSDNDGLLDGDEIGAGVFGGQQLISTAADGASSVIATDVDGDGDVDVLSASYIDQTIAWYENDGTPLAGAWPEHVISTLAGSSPLFAADVDGDGDTDVLGAGTSASSNDISWYENDGTPAVGAWSERKIVNDPYEFHRLAFVADVDGDGDADALAATDFGPIAWYENDGTPSTGLWTWHEIGPPGSYVRSTSAVDMDADGDTDVVTASFYGDTIAWYENDGTPAVGAWIEHVVSASSGEATFVFAADFDGDGDADLLSRSVADSVAWYENDGTPAVGAWPVHSISTLFGAGPSLAADVDGDGDVDVLALLSFPFAVAWYENDGTPAVGAWTQRTISMAVNGTQSTYAADIDGDGDLDVLSASYDDDKIAWYEQLNVIEPPDADSDGDGLSNADEVNIHGTNPYVADTDGDGLLDGFEVNYGLNPLVGGQAAQDPDADGLTNLQEQAAGTNPNAADSDSDGLLDGVELATGINPLDADSDDDLLLDGAEVLIHFTDPLDADSDDDLLTDAAEVNAHGTDPNLADTDGDGLLDSQEIGTGTFGPQQPISASAAFASSVHAADLDGDGDVDVLSASAGDDTVAWYENDGTPLVGAWTERAISTTADWARSVATADLDGDGDLDVLSASEEDDKIAWYENDGTPAVGPWTGRVISTTANGAFSVYTADVDGDGDVDVLSASLHDDTIAWYENDGTPAVGAWLEHTISIAADYARSVVAADLDGDGDTDVLSASQLDHTIAWYENDGTPAIGPWTERAISTSVADAFSVFVADVDGDGEADVLSASNTGDTIAWFENDGTPAVGAWTGSAISTSANGATSVFAADLDRDGDADVLSASVEDDTIAWYENDGTPTVGAWVEYPISTPAAGAWSVIAADVDGDGFPDALSASIFSGRIAWYRKQFITDPLDPDTDGDGLLDGFEVANGFNPLVAGQQGQDPDADGLSNLEEQAAGTNPNVADTDADEALDGGDNCPVTANPTQSDVGSALDDPPDGIGDACQCGDVDDSGVVDFADVDAYRDSLADPVGLALTPAGVAKCSVIDDAGPCEILDVTVVQRALEAVPLLPGIDQVCSAAGGP